MVAYVTLSLLLLIAILPIMCLTIFGLTPSSRQRTDVNVFGIVTLLGVASITWFVY